MLLGYKFYGFTLLAGLFAFLFSYLLSWAIKKFSLKFNITDDPSTQPHRKLQKAPIPLLGGSSFAIVSVLLMGFVCLVDRLNWFNLANIIGGVIWSDKLVWIMLAAIIMLIGGYLDDRLHLSPKYQFIFINLAVIVTVFLGGMVITGPIVDQIQVFTGFVYTPQLLTYAWLGFCIAATKFLDGHDGLVASVGLVGFMAVASVSMFTKIGEPLVFFVSVIWGAGIIGFLPFNFPNAKLYLGEGASEIIGYMIGVLAFLSSAKMVTASTVIGYFIIDLLFVWILRLKDGRNPLTSGDRMHWHHRLMDLGLTKVQVLVVTVMILLITTHYGLWLSDSRKRYALIGQGLFLLIVFSVSLLAKYKKWSLGGHKE